jgi:hypothetical protein
MSYMTLFERSARNATAISLLNKTRHLLIGRDEEVLSDEEIDTLRSAINWINSPNLSQMVIHSFQGFEESRHSFALEIYEALNAAIEGTNSNALKTALPNLTSFLDKKQLEESEKQKVRGLLEAMMKNINQVGAARSRLEKVSSKGL